MMSRVIRWLVYALATGLGSGYSPKAPGTAGSLFALVLVWVLWPTTPLAQIALTASVVMIGVWCSGYVERDRAVHDPQCVVIDEVAGIFITFLGASQPTVIGLLTGFALFRLFDIWKPSIIGKSANLPGGWGVMADDVLAGLVSLAIFTLARVLLPWM